MRGRGFPWPIFASSVNREDIVRGAWDIGVDLDGHVDFVVAALDEESDALGLSRGAA